MKRGDAISRYSLISRFYRILKYYFLVLVRKEDTPESIAHGMAIGILIGFLPIIPGQALTAIAFCFIFKANKFAGIIGTNIFTSWLTAFPVFYLNHFIGKIFIDVNITYQDFISLFTDFSLKNIAEFGWDLFLAVTIGGLIVGAISYLPVYLITKNLVVNFKRRRKK